MTQDEFAAFALSLPGVEESSHFGKRDFRAAARIFATLPAESSANLKFMPDQQMMMVEMHAELFAALPNAWGLRGWTSLNLSQAQPDIALDALTIAHRNIVEKKPRKR